MILEQQLSVPSTKRSKPEGDSGIVFTQLSTSCICEMYEYIPRTCRFVTNGKIWSRTVRCEGRSVCMEETLSERVWNVDEGICISSKVESRNKQRLQKTLILRHIDPLLGNDAGINSYTTVVAR
jgi:hypothetical protein